MAMHEDRRKEELRHLLWIFVDLAIILLIQVFNGLLETGH